MKTILSLLAIISLSVCSVQAQISYGVKAGTNLSKYTTYDNQSYHPSYFITGYADIPLSGRFSLQSGVSLQGKGTKIKDQVVYIEDSDDQFYTETLNTMSIEIPVNLVYYIPAGNGKFFLSGGPYVGYNLSGKIKTSYTNSNASPESRDVVFSGANKMMNRWDFGVNVAAGYKFNNGILIQAGYSHGLLDQDASNYGKSVKTRVLNVGLGYQF